MQRKTIKPEQAKRGDKVSIEIERGSDRDGTVTNNDIDKHKLDIIGDNFVNISVSYDKIEKIEKLVN